MIEMRDLGRSGLKTPRLVLGGNIFGATSAANSAMIVTTTSISMRVTPDCRRLRLLRLFI